ncbi:MAG: hypothetical protein HOI95_04540 [Chromatiales bacterium]|nr:hypothetical protein [Chromatiales bacterium]
MQVYLVGGAVRDELLGIPNVDRDWVVVGATPEQLEQEGFTLKDAQFQVYLHTATHEEHALARREIKIAQGHRGFRLEFGPEISLEDDLARRDLTINAMALSASGHLIDPFGGASDLRTRQLRHVTEAFVEDPLRVWRAAQFAARLAPLGFAVHDDTYRLMRDMCQREDFKTLASSKVWAETCKALNAGGTRVFLSVLWGTGALISCLKAQQEIAFEERLSDFWLGSADQLTATEQLIGFSLFLNNEHPGNDIHIDLLTGLGAPKTIVETARLGASIYANLRKSTDSARASVDFLGRVDALRRPERFEVANKLAMASTHMASERKMLERLEDAAVAARSVNLSELARMNVGGFEKSQYATAAREEAVEREWTRRRSTR